MSHDTMISQHQPPRWENANNNNMTPEASAAFQAYATAAFKDFGFSRAEIKNLRAIWDFGNGAQVSNAELRMHAKHAAGAGSPDPVLRADGDFASQIRPLNPEGSDAPGIQSLTPAGAAEFSRLAIEAFSTDLWISPQEMRNLRSAWIGGDGDPSITNNEIRREAKRVASEMGAIDPQDADSDEMYMRHNPATDSYYFVPDQTAGNPNHPLYVRDDTGTYRPAETEDTVLRRPHHMSPDDLAYENDHSCDHEYMRVGAGPDDHHMAEVPDASEVAQYYPPQFLPENREQEWGRFLDVARDFATKYDSPSEFVNQSDLEQLALLYAQATDIQPPVNMMRAIAQAAQKELEMNGTPENFSLEGIGAFFETGDIHMSDDGMLDSNEMNALIGLWKEATGETVTPDRIHTLLS